METLDDLPRTPNGLYDIAMPRIEAQDERDADRAKQVFAWIYYAREPLSLGQLQYALAIRPGDKAIDQAGCVKGDILTTTCGGLVVLDKESQIVRFVHPTTRSYLECYFSTRKDVYERFLAVSLLTFFHSDTFTSITSSDSRLMVLPLPLPLNSSHFEADKFRTTEEYRETSFLAYAARHMTNHLQPTQNDEQIFEMIKALFDDLKLLSRYWRVRMHYSAIASWNNVAVLQNEDKLRVAASFRLGRIVEWLIRCGHSPNARDSPAQTPLYAAVRNNESTIVGMLLDNGADIDQISSLQAIFGEAMAFKSGRSPLECAVSQRNLSIAQLLVGRGAKVSSMSLLLALWTGSREMVEFILKQKPENIHTKGPDGNPPLHKAIEIGSPEIVNLLLNYGANTNQENNDGIIPIEVAITKGSDDVHLLLCKMIAKHTPMENGFVKSERFHKYWPWMNSHRPESLRCLREQSWTNRFNDQGSKLQSLWSNLCNGLQSVAENEAHNLYTECIIVEELEKLNVLLYSVNRGFVPTTQCLLEMANRLQCGLDLRDRALCEAIQSNRPHLVDILLDAGADPNTNALKVSPLSLAVLSNSLEIVERLLGKGAKASALCPMFGSVIRAVYHEKIQTNAVNNSVPMLALLANAGAEVNTSLDGKTPLLLISIAKECSEDSLIRV